MVALLTAGVAVLAPAVHGQTPSESALAEARDAWRAGRYEAAVDRYRRLVERQTAYPAAARALVGVLLEVGRHTEAERAARAAIEAHPGSPELLAALGRVLRLSGRDREAERTLREALEGGASDSLEARLELARLRERHGARQEALAAYTRVAEAYAAGSALSPRQLTAAGEALARLGAREPDLYHTALRAFEQAVKADPGDPAPRLRAGELFLDRYDSREAGASFDEVLARNPRHPEALLGMARRAWFDGSSEAFELVGRALETNPRLVPARVFVARLHLDVEEYASAKAEARRALQVEPGSLEALTSLAAGRFLENDPEGFTELERDIQRHNPRYAGLYTTVAELAVRNRLYADAAELARRAVQLDPEAWAAHGILGVNLLRTGRIAEGRSHLEAAFAGDPFNPWYKNTLDLLDLLQSFREVPGKRARLLLHPDEAELLSLYMVPLVEEALDRLGAHYGALPELPLRIEVYDRHADFSVRTVGLAGLGALGVSFGSVLAMDSPSARERGAFSWASTLWHEISHAFTLELTRHRIPRWFSEGLAVLDEHRARAPWGADPSPDFLVAVLQGRLLPLERLNRGFVRPSYPGQIQHAYLHAYLVCRMIEEEEGTEAILRMLGGYRQGLDTEAVFRQVLGLTPDAFDVRFRGWLEARYERPLEAMKAAAGRIGDGGLLRRARGAAGLRDPEAGVAGSGEPRPDDFPAQLAKGRRLYEEGRSREALPYLERAKALYPGYAAPDAPEVYLAEIHASGGDEQRAIAELEELVAVAENAWLPNLRLAELREATGDLHGAAEALQRALEIDPFEPGGHERLAKLLEAVGAWERAIRERRALVALDPVDRAGALYRLARVEERAGRTADARKTVLQALEIAPTYEEALELLLRLSEVWKGEKL